jgi:hypothetical protein
MFLELLAIALAEHGIDAQVTSAAPLCRKREFPSVRPSPWRRAVL